MSEEQASYCAGILSPYITSIDSFAYNGTVDLDSIEFVFPDATEEFKVGEEIQQKLVGHFPNDTLEGFIYNSAYNYYVDRPDAFYYGRTPNDISVRENSDEKKSIENADCCFFIDDYAFRLRQEAVGWQ